MLVHFVFRVHGIKRFALTLGGVGHFGSFFGGLMNMVRGNQRREWRDMQTHAAIGEAPNFYDAPQSRIFLPHPGTDVGTNEKVQPEKYPMTEVSNKSYF